MASLNQSCVKELSHMTSLDQSCVRGMSHMASLDRLCVKGMSLITHDISRPIMCQRDESDDTFKPIMIHVSEGQVT